MSRELLISGLKGFLPIVWLALAAALQMTGALLFFGITADLTLVGTYSVIAFSIYLLNRFTDVEDSYNCPSQGAFFRGRRIGIAAPVALMLASLGLLLLTRQWTVSHLLLAISGTLYSVRIVPWVIGRRVRLVRLKNILFLKNISVSLLWGLSPFAIAYGQVGAISPPFKALLVVTLAFCLTTLMNTMSCDVRDMDGDRQAGIRTVATSLGKQGTGLLLLLVAVAGSALVGSGMLFGGVDGRVASLFFASVAWTALVALPIYSQVFDLPKAISEPLIDTQQVFCGVGLILFVLWA